MSVKKTEKLRYAQSRGYVNFTNHLLHAAVQKDSKLNVIIVVVLIVIALLLEIHSLWKF